MTQVHHSRIQGYKVRDDIALNKRQKFDMNAGAWGDFQLFQSQEGCSRYSVLDSIGILDYQGHLSENSIGRMESFVKLLSILEVMPVVMPVKQYVQVEYNSAFR